MCDVGPLWGQLRWHNDTEELLASCRGTGQRLEGAELEWHAADSDIRVGIRCVWHGVNCWIGIEEELTQGASKRGWQGPESCRWMWTSSDFPDIHSWRKESFICLVVLEGSFHRGREARTDISGYCRSQKETGMLMLNLPAPFLLTGPSL